MKKRRLGALLAAGALALSFAGTAMAAGPFTVDWDGGGVKDGAIQTVKCDKDNPPGTIYWILTTGGGNATDATLTVNSDSHTDGWASGGGWKWQTPLYDLDGLTASAEWSGTAGNGASNLVISHYCPAETTTSTTTSETTTDETTTDETTTTETTTEETTTDETTTEETTTDETTTSQDTTSQETTSSETTSSETTSEETTSSQTKAKPTPPSTDTISTTGSSTGGMSPLLLLVFAGFLGGALLLVPSKARTRR